MAALLPALDLQPWNFEKDMMQSQHSSPSDYSSGEIFEDKIKIASQIMLKSTKNAVASTTLDQKYMSSDEELSPEEEMDTSADELDEDMENFRAAIKVAIAICLMPAPCKPKLVDIPCPSLTNSPSIQSTASGDSSNDDFGARPPTPVRSSKRRTVTFPTGVPFIASRQSSIESISQSGSPRSPAFHTPTRANHSIPSSPITPVTPTNHSKHAFLDEDPFITPKKPTHQGHSRLRSLSGKFSHLVTRKDSSRSISSPLPLSSTVPQKHATLRRRASMQKPGDSTSTLSGSVTSVSTNSSHQTLVPLPTSSSPKLVQSSKLPSSKRKLIARGASEREPAFELPPFPADDLQPPPRRRQSALGL